MTNDNVTNARDVLGNAVTGSFDAGTRGANAIARIAVAIVQAMVAGNDAAFTLVSDGKDVTISPDVLRRYAGNTLPKKDAEASADMPTASMLINALAGTSERLRKAEDEAAQLRVKAKDKATTPLAMVQLRAEAERLAQAVNTAKQPIRRALVLAAYIANASRTIPDPDDASATIKLPLYDMSKTDERDGVVYVTPAKDGGEAQAPEALTYTFAHERMKGAANKRAPNGQTAQVSRNTSTGIAVDAEGNAAGVTVTAEGMRKGGAQRDALPQALDVLSGLLSDLDGGARNATERKALARLYVQIERLLDDDAFSLVAELRDEGEAA